MDVRSLLACGKVRVDGAQEREEAPVGSADARCRLRPEHDERGFTMIELLVVMLILGTILGGILALFVSGTQAQIDLNIRFQAQLTARLALDGIRREVHCASSASPAGPTSSITLVIPAGCTPTALAGGNITWCTRGTAPRFQLFRAVGGACTGGTEVADYLTLANAFNYTAGPGVALGRLRVEFRVDPDPAKTSRAYALVDNLVLRNEVR